MMPDVSASGPSVLFFIALPVGLISLFVWGIASAWRLAGIPAARARRSALVAGLAALAWMSVTGLAAASGIFSDWTRTPPPFMGLVAAIFALAFGIAFSRLGARLSALPLWALVAVQSFRLPLEVVMHRLVQHGIMPEQMSYTGRNWDVLTGITAVLVAGALRTRLGGGRLALAWNIVGLGLLANVLVIAIASTPRFAAFGPDHLNVFVTYVPFVWLPAVMVLTALAGHLVIFRALSRPGPR
jgi:hypothetical protein